MNNKVLLAHSCEMIPKAHYRTRIMMSFQVKIHELELKLQEEEHQRKLVQNKANQVPKWGVISRGLFNMSSNMLNCRGFHHARHPLLSCSRVWRATESCCSRPRRRDGPARTLKRGMQF